jgi:DNA ligase (NAD+)
LVYSLGIRHIGLENAKLISKYFKTFSKFKALSRNKRYNELLNIDGIGETQVNSVKNFFSNKVNIDVLNQLEATLNIKDTLEENKNGKLKEKTFMITGKLNGISRAEVKSLIEENAGTTVSSVSKKLNYLIIGEKPTKRKIETAKNLKIITLDQKQFLTLLNETS